MTEAEWLACDDPDKMLRFLGERPTDRKLRLFACACVRRVGHLLTDERHRRVLATAERCADRDALDKTLRAHLAQAEQAVRSVKPIKPNKDSEVARSAAQRAAQAAVLAAGRRMRWVEATGTAAVAAHAWKLGEQNADLAKGLSNPGRALAELARETARQAGLLRCIVGSPFRTPAGEPAWLVWNDRIIPNLAQAIYQERSFDRLPILGDALEEAGCTDQDILAHCRQAGEHARGCWVIDLILGRS